MGFDIHEINERAAIKEYCGGMSRFEAETEAAAEIGKKRWELFKHENDKRDFERGRNRYQQASRNATNDVSAMQPHTAQQAGSVFVCLIQAGWGSVALLALCLEWRAVL